jgi:hypothetical protein
MTPTAKSRIETAQRMLEEAKAEIAHPDCPMCLHVNGVFDRIGQLYGHSPVVVDFKSGSHRHGNRLA